MGNRGHNRRRIHQLIVSFTLQHSLHLASLRHIVGHFCEADERPTAVVNRVDHNTCPKLTPVFADAPSFSLELALSGRLTKGFCWKPRLPIQICVKARKMPAYYFIASVTLYTFGTAVPACDATRLIQRINRKVLDALNQYCKLRQLALSLLRLC